MSDNGADKEARIIATEIAESLCRMELESAALGSVHIQEIERILAAHAPAPGPAPTPRMGDTICQICGMPNPSWVVDMEIWNLVVPERAGILCLRCFVERALSLGITGGWKLIPESETNSLILGGTPLYRRQLGQELISCHAKWVLDDDLSHEEVQNKICEFFDLPIKYPDAGVPPSEDAQKFLDCPKCGYYFQFPGPADCLGVPKVCPNDGETELVVRAKSSPPAAPPVKLTNRQRVYDFMSLPTHRKLERLRDLGIYEEGDVDLPGDECDLVWIKRAKAKGLADALLDGEREVH